MSEIPNKYNLLTSQRNDIFKCVQDEEFDPSAFVWGTSESWMDNSPAYVPTLYFTGTDYFFEFEKHLGNFTPRYSPGLQSEVDSFRVQQWKDVVSHVRRWLGFIRREAELPDLWDSLMTERPLVNSVGNYSEETDSNTPFTITERGRVAQGLEEIKAYLKSAKTFTLEQQKLIDHKFEYLVEASSRMGRKDWLALLLGTLLSTAVTVGLDGTSTRDWIGFASNIVRQFAGYLLLPPTPYY